MNQDWIGTVGKFATAVIAVSAIVGGIVMAIVSPRLETERVARQEADARIKTQLVLGVRDRIDLIDAIQSLAPQNSPVRERLAGLKQKLEQEARMIEGH